MCSSLDAIDKDGIQVLRSIISTYVINTAPSWTLWAPHSCNSLKPQNFQYFRATSIRYAEADNISKITVEVAEIIGESTILENQQGHLS